MQQYGEKLRKAREFLDLTQDQVARVLDISRNAVVNIENNNRAVKAEELAKFSKLYGISMEEIVSDENEVNLNIPLFARGFNKLTPKDQEEVLNFIKFKNSYKG